MATPIYFPGHSINKTAAELGVAPGWLQPYATRLQRYGGGVNNTWVPGAIDLQFLNYDVPLRKMSGNKYSIDDATGWVRVFQSTNEMNTNGKMEIPPGTWMPWNPAWQPGGGSDAIMIVRDEVNDVTYGFWMMKQPWVNGLNFTNISNGFLWGDKMVVGAASITRGNLTSPATHVQRGSGIDKLLGIVTGYELAAENIPHAMEITIAATSFGPKIASKSGVVPPTPTPPAGTGETMGFAVAPATRVEWLTGPPACGASSLKPADLNKASPHGLRVALKPGIWNDARINKYIADEAISGPLRGLTQTLLRTGVERGWVVLETACWGIGQEMTGVNGSQEEREALATVGVTSGTVPQARKVLARAWADPNDLYVVNPA